MFVKSKNCDETYEYDDWEDSEDMSEPAHLFAGCSVVPRHDGYDRHT